jgi:hypothetical protein
MTVPLLAADGVIVACARNEPRPRTCSLLGSGSIGLLVLYSVSQSTYGLLRTPW